MSISTLPLSYCTNVHPAQTVAEVLSGLTDYTIPARERFGEKIAAGLWLPASAISELDANPGLVTQLKQKLTDGDLVCYTLNTFPYGNFHSERVKENVYIPDWTTSERFDYTVGCARILSELMPDGVEGSLSTVPLGFKAFDHAADFESKCIDQLLQLAVSLDDLHDETGRVIRLAIEPEPLCVLETTVETIAFFKKVFATADERDQGEIARRHLGVCYDVCHQAIEFEDVKASIEQLSAEGIRVNKVHITCAIHIDSPISNSAAREQLAGYVEQRYLHQTFAKSSDGTIVHQTDLSPDLCASPSSAFAEAESWRVHFHVPVHRDSIGELKTTRDELKIALKAVAQLDYAPQLEVETYTWGVLPGEEQPDLVDGLVAELAATRDLLSEC